MSSLQSQLEAVKKTMMKRHSRITESSVKVKPVSKLCSGDTLMRLYVCGSFRFRREIEELEQKLKKENIQCQSSKMDAGGILGCLKKVDDADVVYVVDPEGYVGKSVSVDIGYAYGKGKAIYVMHPVDDPPIMDLTNGVLPPKALIDLFKRSPANTQ